MHTMNNTKMISIVLAIVMMLFVPVQQAAAWGDIGHYGIVRDAVGSSVSDSALGGGVAPDALLDALYGTNTIDELVHVDSNKYNPLSYDLFHAAKDGPSTEWAIQFTGHTNADQSANNYALTAGADTLSAHYIAEFAGDILTYWSHPKIMPGYVIVYPYQIEDALVAYDNACRTSYSKIYEPTRYANAYAKLQAVIIAERAVIDYKQNNKIDFLDKIYLNWANSKYTDAYRTFYPIALNDVRNTNPENFVRFCPGLDTSITSAVPTKSKTYRSEIAGIKMHIGEKLIDNGLIKTHKKSDQKSGAVIINFDQTVNDEKLAKAYEKYLEEVYEEQTGERVNILEKIRSEGKLITDQAK